MEQTAKNAKSTKQGLMPAHCHACLARFEIPKSPTAPVKCPECGSGQVIDHNLEAISPEEELAAFKAFLARN
jgi:hypothetical protein